MWFNDVSGIPGFSAGIIERGGEFAGAKNLRVSYAPSTDANCTYVVEWDE